jgi:hypothetical protein
MNTTEAILTSDFLFREMPGEEEMFYNTIRKRKNPGKYFADSPS